MMMNTNMDVVNNLAEFESFNIPGVQDFLLSLSGTEGFSDHQNQRPQIPSFCNDAPSINPDYSSLHVQVPGLNFDSLSSYFPQGGGSSSRGCNNNNNVVQSSESDSLRNSSSGFVLPNKADAGYNCGGKKRKRSTDKEVQKPKEVVHVRAKRGQATDSHSLAERLRREKINEKLRCLQDLVPGCYKTMGMAVMLDVIINYVRSLQNQIDFLSMKLSAASLYYDFNSSDMDALGTMQLNIKGEGFDPQGIQGFEAQGMEKMLAEGYGVFPQSHSSWPL